MNWEDRLLGAEELKAFVAPPSAENNVRPPLPSEGGATNALVIALLRQQVETWPMLRDATAALRRAEYKQYAVKDSTVYTQFNPARIVSTGAKVDSATIQKRPCFLCADNLPAEEKGLAFGERFVILCNPFPVLRNHLVISSRRHTPQEIDGNFVAMLDLARELGPEWFVLYNGPRCGASAPDHLHFQACAAANVPLFAEFGFLLDRDRMGLIQAVRHDYRVNLIAFGSADQRDVVGWFNDAVRHLMEVTDSDIEPMLNLIVAWRNGQWTVFVFPRGKHRPACYDAEGDAKLTVSPAAIDLAGVMVVPQREHFQRITADDLSGIYAEVTLDGDRFERWLELLKGNSEGGQ